MSKLAHSSPFMDAIEQSEDYALEGDEPSEIITHHEFPPIPIRDFDWIAYRKGNEEGLCGRGWTEAAAITDLLDREGEQ